MDQRLATQLPANSACFFLGPLPSEVPPLMAPVPPGVALILKAALQRSPPLHCLPQGLPPVISQAEQAFETVALNKNLTRTRSPGPLSSLWGSLQRRKTP